MFAPAYLDHNATTPLDARVREAMLPWFGTRHGNASSRHEYGRAARAAIDEARQRVAAAVNAHPTEVIFTSGGSEANNLFLKGAAAQWKTPGTLAVSAIEHPCVREPARQLAKAGWTLAVLPVDGEGRIDRAAFADALAARPRIVSVMRANNETGVLQDVAALAAEARGAGAWFHCDAVQALGKIDVDFRALGVHGLTLSAHKLGGPLGAGALVIDKRVELAPQIAGGGQERALRSGTENVMAIVGFGVACELAAQEWRERAERAAQLRARLEAGLEALGARIFSQHAGRLPNTSFFALPGLDGETLVGKLDRDGFAAASGSACSSANPEPSATLTAMGVEPQIARGALRVSIGAGNTEHDIDGFLAALDAQADSLRRLAALAV